jgi:opacity protein-like surface antigen
MKRIILAAALAIAATAAQAQGTNQNGHPVQGTGGTHVQPHQQTSPNSTQRDSATGNANTNTGGVGTRKPRTE